MGSVLGSQARLLGGLVSLHFAEDGSAMLEDSRRTRFTITLAIDSDKKDKTTRADMLEALIEELEGMTFYTEDHAHTIDTVEGTP